MDETTAKTKVCKFCGRELTLDHFNKCASAKDGHQTYCRECQALINKENYAKNEAARQARREEKKAARAAEKAAKAAAKATITLADFTPKEIFAYLASIGYRWSEKAIWHEEVIVKKDFVVPSRAINQ